MNVPLTNAAEVAARLNEALQVQNSVALELVKADTAAVTAKLAYDHAYSRAFLVAEGAMDVRKHTALDQTHALRVTAEMADLQVRNYRRRLDALRTEIDITRSIGAGVRAEASAFGGTGGMR